jgi:hypothetical protein
VTTPAGVPSRERLRFQEFTFQRLSNGRCRSTVLLTWSDGRRFEGSAEAVTSPAGELRCAAEAAVGALARVVGAEASFEILGVKAVRAFDATVVIVSLSSREAEKASRLVGSFLTESDAPRGAALAVMNATNRILGNYFSTR